MANLMDYLDWRGDLRIADNVFNEVDSLILSGLSYADLEGAVPAPGQGETRLSEAAASFFSSHTEKELEEDRSMIAYAPFILKKAAGTARFRDMIVRNYVNIVDAERNLQFSAVEFVTDDGISYVAFRGTDDTIVGWKEDFLFSCGIVPSEEYAADYLNLIHAGSGLMLRVGGHSKGGHLAVYASAMAKPEIRERIRSVFSFDGPGFREEFLQGEGFLAIRSRIRKLVPETSIVGMLLDQEAPSKVVASSEKGIGQHQPLSWEVMGPSFVRLEELSDTAKLFSEAFQSWIGPVAPGERRAFVDDLFAVLEAPGLSTLTEYRNGGIKSLGVSYERLRQLDGKHQELLWLLIKLLGSEWTEQLKETLKSRIHFPARS
ncbi:MAG: DUF2974 domain-containing protein [Lachnospiraceae bacterium]|nr:DUF2974 domain-containing protein [Lachnospiraceae bacterium]